MMPEVNSFVVCNQPRNIKLLERMFGTKIKYVPAIMEKQQEAQRYATPKLKYSQTAQSFYPNQSSLTQRNHSPTIFSEKKDQINLILDNCKSEIEHSQGLKKVLTNVKTY